MLSTTNTCSIVVLALKFNVPLDTQQVISEMSLSRQSVALVFSIDTLVDGAICQTFNSR